MLDRSRQLPKAISPNHQLSASALRLLTPTPNLILLEDTDSTYQMTACCNCFSIFILFRSAEMTETVHALGQHERNVKPLNPPTTRAPGENFRNAVCFFARSTLHWYSTAVLPHERVFKVHKTWVKFKLSIIVHELSNCQRKCLCAARIKQRLLLFHFPLFHFLQNQSTQSVIFQHQQQSAISEHIHTVWRSHVGLDTKRATKFEPRSLCS